MEPTKDTGSHIHSSSTLVGNCEDDDGGEWIDSTSLSSFFTNQQTTTSEEEAEEALADACSDGMLWLRMDRVKRIVVFKQPKRAESVLTDWTSDVKGIMDGLDKIVYLIEKERMVKEVN